MNFVDVAVLLFLELRSVSRPVAVSWGEFHSLIRYWLALLTQLQLISGWEVGKQKKYTHTLYVREAH